MKYITALLFLILNNPTFSQQGKASRLIEQGNKMYKQGQFAAAESAYRQALASDPAGETALFNLGNAVYRQNRQVDAAQIFLSLADKSINKQLLAKTYYNQGVILSSQKNLEQSIEAYKKALRIDPADQDARENLQKALLELKKKQQQDKKQDKQKKKQQEEKQSPKMDLRQAEQRLKLLEQKEKEVQQRIQGNKAGSSGSRSKDW